MMSEVFGWFGDAARGILSVFPQRRIIKAGHAGIRYGPRGGIDVLPAGWYFLFPLFQDFEQFPIARQTVDVAKQPLMTKDGKTVTAGGAMRFSVNDVHLFCIENYNTFEDIDDVAQVALRDVVISHTLEVLQTDRERLDRELRIRAQRRLRSYGVRVHEFNLKGLAPAQLIHVVSDSQVPVLIQNQQEIQ
jgi:regulator of protease activity HflC (stomatin/prohibitin superfamily)